MNNSLKGHEQHLQWEADFRAEWGDHVELSDWEGLYGERWSGTIVPEAMSHPAKFSSALIRKIYDHAEHLGWLQAGDKIIDPFGGVALGALHAVHRGMTWIGIEIEQHFVDMGAGCECTGVTKEDWVRFQGRLDRVRYKDGRHICPRCVAEAKKVVERKSNQTDFFDQIGSSTVSYRRNSGNIPSVLPHHYSGNLESRGWIGAGSIGKAMLIKGDSRFLLKILRGGVDATLTSPPYAEARIGKESGAEQIGHNEAYGGAEGQLGGMKDSGFDASLTSPPFTGVSSDGGWQMLGKYAEEGRLTVDQVGGDKRKKYPSWSPDRDTDMGGSAGNLSKMTEGDVDMALSSPPFRAQTGGSKLVKRGPLSDQSLIDRHRAGNLALDPYGDSEGNLATMDDKEFDAAIGSPPFAEVNACKDPNYREGRSGGGGPLYGEYGQSDGQLASMPDDGVDMALSSPPYAETSLSGGGGIANEMRGTYRAEARNYGDEGGQLGAMKDQSFEAALSSPPYGTANEGMGLNVPGQKPESMRGVLKDGSLKSGESDGNLDAMKNRENFEAAVTSPPFEGVTSDRPSPNIVEGGLRMGASSMGDGYGDTSGNLGGPSMDDFWGAARAILDQLFIAIKPGGHAIFVVKDYVKDFSVVPFSDRWAKLCEAAGFELVHWHRAWVVEDLGTQFTLENGAETLTRERKSFFRRMTEKKGGPRIDWESVLCFERPA